jgi:uncharacterized protein involved in type VI secretion and phage assembly
MRPPKQTELPQIGIVTSVNNSTYRAKVYLPLLNMETDYIRIATIYAGAGWGVRGALHGGNEVLVVFPNGDLNNGIITNIIYSEGSDQPPGEGDNFSLVHESGSVMRFDKAGNITIAATGNLTLNGAKVFIN